MIVHVLGTSKYPYSGATKFPGDVALLPNLNSIRFPAPCTTPAGLRLLGLLELI